MVQFIHYDAVFSKLLTNQLFFFNASTVPSILFVIQIIHELYAQEKKKNCLKKLNFKTSSIELKNYDTRIDIHRIIVYYLL